MLPDYVLPVTIHDFVSQDCPEFTQDLVQNPIKMLLQLGLDFNDALKVKERPDAEFIHRELASHSGVFLASAKTRAYPMHIHGRRNENFMLLLDGAKRFVFFDPSEVPNLYRASWMARTEVGSGDVFFEPDPLNPDFERFPKLKRVGTGRTGLAKKGDLIYIPCGSVHMIQNEEDVLAVAWHVDIVNGAPCPGRSIRQWYVVRARLKATARTGRTTCVAISALAHELSSLSIRAHPHNLPSQFPIILQACTGRQVPDS